MIEAKLNWSDHIVHLRVSPKAMEDAVRLSLGNYCSVSARLEKTARIRPTIEYAA